MAKRLSLQFRGDSASSSSYRMGSGSLLNGSCNCQSSSVSSSSCLNHAESLAGGGSASAGPRVTVTSDRGDVNSVLSGSCGNMASSGGGLTMAAGKNPSRGCEDVRTRMRALTNFKESMQVYCVWYFCGYKNVYNVNVHRFLRTPR